MPVFAIDDALRNGSPDTASGLFKFVLSTIQSPAFSQVAVLYQFYDFPSLVLKHPFAETYVRQLSQDEEAEEAEKHRKRFEVLREICRVRNFRFVLYAAIRDVVAEPVRRMMKEAVAAEKARGGFNVLFPETPVTFTSITRLQISLYVL